MRCRVLLHTTLKTAVGSPRFDYFRSLWSVLPCEPAEAVDLSGVGEKEADALVFKDNDGVPYRCFFAENELRFLREDAFGSEMIFAPNKETAYALKTPAGSLFVEVFTKNIQHTKTKNREVFIVEYFTCLDGICTRALLRLSIETLDAKETAENSDAIRNANATEATDIINTTDTAKSSDTAEAPDTAKSADTADAPDNADGTGTADTTDTLDSTESADITNTTNTTNTTDPTKTTRPPEETEDKP